jgi:hypothetical protein
MLAANHGISVALAMFGIIVLVGFVVEQVGLDIRRARRRRRRH